MISILFFSLSSAVCIQLFVKAHTINQATEDKSNAILIAQDICELFHHSDGDKTQLLLYYSDYERNEDSYLFYFSAEGTICTYADAKYEALLTFGQELSYQTLTMEIRCVNEKDVLYSSRIKKYNQAVI